MKIKMKSKLRTVATLFTVIVVSGCGGSGGSSDEPEFVTAFATDDGCEQEFYQTLTGTYSGTLLFDDNGARVPRICAWDMRMELIGQSIGNFCALRAVIDAPVNQITFDEEVPYDCISVNGSREVTEPVSSITLLPGTPMVDNSNFPTPLRVENLRLPREGPYSQDSSRTADYVYLFDEIIGSLVETVIANGDGTLTVSLRSSAVAETGNIIAGTLVKE